MSNQTSRGKIPQPDSPEDLIKEIFDDVVRTVELRKVDASGGVFPIYGKELFDRTKAKLLHREQMAVLHGRLAEIQNWFGSYLKSYENWTDEFDMDFVKERITELEAAIQDEHTKGIIKTSAGTIYLEDVDRFEVIDDTGRAYVKGSIYGTPVKVELSYQNDGRTLKVFVAAIEKERKL